MATRWINAQPVPERVGWGYFGELHDEAGQPIVAADFSVLTVRIYVLDAAETEIAPPESILNTGRGTLDASGLLTIIFRPGDSVIVNPASEINLTPRKVVKGERHLALVEGLYATNREFAREIEWPVVNLSKRGA